MGRWPAAYGHGKGKYPFRYTSPGNGPGERSAPPGGDRASYMAKSRNTIPELLLRLAQHAAEAPQLRWHASYTAGVLFAADPVLIEGRILRPWAHSDQSPLRRCAGLALGAPLAAGADPTPSRALAHAWGTSGSVNLREAAITAYGGLLGAWDPISAAPLKLFRIGQTTPVLRHDADLALARLMVAGAEASAAREGVLAYLKLAVTDRGPRTESLAAWLGNRSAHLASCGLYEVTHLAAIRTRQLGHPHGSSRDGHDHSSWRRPRSGLSLPARPRRRPGSHQQRCRRRRNPRHEALSARFRHHAQPSVRFRRHSQSSPGPATMRSSMSPPH